MATPRRSRSCPPAGQIDAKGDVDPNHVVHVVQESVLRAAPKTHATRSITVNSGLLWSVENAGHAAAILQKCR